MRASLLYAAAGLAALASAQQDLVINPKNAQDGSTSTVMSVPIDISHLRDNKGFGMKPGEANFDGLHSGYPAQTLPAENFTYGGVNYIFPQYQADGNDNVLAQGQMLTIPKGRYIGVRMLAAAETAIATGFINATYVDNSTTSGPIQVDPFWAWPNPYGGDITFSSYLTNSSSDKNRSMIYQTVNWLDGTKELTSLQLPNVTKGSASGPRGTSENTRLHVFSVSLIPANGNGLALEVQYVRSTNMWFEGTNKTQIVEATISNVGTEWVLANNTVQLSVEANGLKTVVPGVVNRLRPGDQVKVDIGVVNANGVTEGTTGEATLNVSGQGISLKTTFNATMGITDYQPTYDDTFRHESPQWYNGAKYGIFIHWGVYSVPGWGNVGKNESYAEWYWWDYNKGPDQAEQIWQYNLKTYGPNHEYDDFIQNFTAEVFNPKDWVDLFADAGAQYFVQVSKHHDGYAIFDLPANVTKRTSVAQFPHRNLLQELFDAAKQYQPQLHRGTYYSLPEWFNPAYAQFGFSQWPGGNATNPYTNKTLPYTGYVHVDNYVSDVLYPEMMALSEMGTEIMWCDIGGPNMTPEFLANFFNTNAQEGRQVLSNNRCGTPGDFDTPEYARYDAVQVRKWESSLGMDPFSYGYNRATPDDAYLTAQGIVTSLMDIISKNGNFLLDIGPTANGTVIEIEQKNLREAGVWIKSHAEAIFNTTYWYITPEEGDTVRFTQNSNAFYITTLYAPNATLTLSNPVPYVPGDKVTVVGGKQAGTVVPSRLTPDGQLVLTISDDIKNGDQYAWVFKIDFGSSSGSGSGSVGGNGTASGTGSGGAAAPTRSSGPSAVPTNGMSKLIPSSLGSLLMVALCCLMF